MPETPTVTKLPVKPRYWIIVPENAKWSDTDVDLYRTEVDAIDAARAACSSAPIQPYHVMACIPVVRVEMEHKIDIRVTPEEDESE